MACNNCDHLWSEIKAKSETNNPLTKVSQRGGTTDGDCNNLNAATTRRGPSVQGKGIPRYCAKNAPVIDAVSPTTSFKKIFTTQQP